MRQGNDSFIANVIHQVDQYFEENKLSRFANTEMWVKTIVMLLIFFVPYILIISGVGSSLMLFYGLWFIMGIGIVGIGTSVMHDACHGSYSASKNVNNFISHVLEVIGGYTVTWKIQHNVLHHTYTNISGLDEDIDNSKLLRFTPNKEKKRFHRYQHIYAWMLYSLLTLFWMTVKDYFQLVRYKKYDLLIKEKITLRKAIIRMTIFKVLYIGYIIILPIILLEIPWYHVLVGFLVMHLVGGFLLSIVFQPSHVIETSGYAVPVVEDGKMRMEDSWAIHEVANTTNFAPNNKILTWFIGGLNYQIEHHLFSGICHVHYKNLAPIVRAACVSYNMPYNVKSTFINAIVSHGRMLKKLGRE